MMKHLVLYVFLFFVLATPAWAQFSTKAQQAVLLDTQTGTVLLEKNADEPMPTSSMSKVMTMYAVFRALKDGRLNLEDTLEISEKAWRMGGSKMFIEVGKHVQVEDLVRGVVVQSGNDATVALAEGLAGSEAVFAENLNQIAQSLGMQNSHFVNASGWPDPNHYSTARDLARLAYHTIYDFPEYYHYWAEKEFTYNGIKQHNRNLLLFRNMNVDGLKTGHTEAAGYGLMSTAERNGRRLILVVNGLGSEKERADESARLLEWAFATFETVDLFKGGTEIERANVWLGQPKTVPLVIEQDVKISLPRAQKSDLKVSVQYQEPLPAPIQKGAVVGKLVVEIPGLKNREYPLKAGETSTELGFFQRTLSKANFFLMGAN